MCGGFREYAMSISDTKANVFKGKTCHKFTISRRIARTIGYKIYSNSTVSLDRKMEKLSYWVII